MIVRLLLLVSLFIWVVALNGLSPIFLLCFMFFYLLHIQGFALANFLRSFYMLTWLFFPIFIFHGFFTSGTMVQYPIYLPISEEGLLRALDLSTHLGLVFFSALVAFRLFSKDEWFGMLGESKAGIYLKPYIHLISGLRSEMLQVLHKRKKEWLKMEHRWSKLPQVLLSMIQNMLVQAKEQASKLWLDWDLIMQESGSQPASLYSSKDRVYLISMMLGWGIFWFI